MQLPPPSTIPSKCLYFTKRWLGYFCFSVSIIVHQSERYVLVKELFILCREFTLRLACSGLTSAFMARKFTVNSVIRVSGSTISKVGLKQRMFVPQTKGSPKL